MAGILSLKFKSKFVPIETLFFVKKNRFLTTENTSEHHEIVFQNQSIA